MTWPVAGHGAAMRRSEAGATAVEYALMAGLVAVAIALAVTSIGLSLADIFQDVADGFP